MNLVCGTLKPSLVANLGQWRSRLEARLSRASAQFSAFPAVRRITVYVGVCKRSQAPSSWKNITSKCGKTTNLLGKTAKNLPQNVPKFSLIMATFQNPRKYLDAAIYRQYSPFLKSAPAGLC
jgi:hypothetical protein